MTLGTLGLVIVLAAIACTARARTHTSPVSVRAGAFSIVASAELDQAGDTAGVMVHLRNEATSATSVSLGECALSVSIAPSNSAGNRAAWDQAHWQPNRSASPSIGRVCHLYERLLSTAAGAAVTAPELSARFASRQLLGDSLPAGIYRFIARVAFNDTVVVVVLGDLPLRTP